tara:strand:- start:64 stop:1161 length:1098 start_codon:yes stop_codon:yes gene_type:complete
MVCISICFSNSELRTYNNYLKNTVGNETPAFSFKEGSTRQISNAKYLYDKTVNDVVYVVGAYGSGSGIVISPYEILTNYHVVHNSSKAAYHLFNRDVTVLKQVADEPLYEAEVVALDKDRDLALLRTKKRLSTSGVLFARNSSISVGDDVFAIGHPAGNIWSYCQGTISALPSPYEWSYSSAQSGMVANCIQTQTPTNPGNSGGPLLNSRGHLVGVNSFGSPGYEGLNFAVRIDEVESFLVDARNGRYPKGVDTEAEYKVLSRQECSELGFPGSRIEAIDTNFSGQYDEYWIYEDSDDNVDFIFWDWNDDGTPNMVWNGELNLFFIDDTYDGYPDRVGRDTDADEDPWPDDFISYGDWEYLQKEE